MKAPRVHLAAHEDLAVTIGTARVGYAEYGDTSGVPVLFAHGFPGTRLEGRHLDSVARATGVRLIAPDRPGLGQSAQQTYSCIADWSNTATRFVNALQLDRFSVLGVSGGGPYALAVAAMLPERVVHTAVVASPCPIDKEVLAAMRLFDRAAVELARRSPAAFRYLLRRLLSRQPETLVRWVTHGLAEVDVVAASGTAVASSLRNNIREATRHGTAGLQREGFLYALDWGFSPADVTGDVDVWHGHEDNLIPLAMGRKLARQLPRAVAHFEAGQGHLSLVHTRAREILTSHRL